MVDFITSTIENGAEYIELYFYDFETGYFVNFNNLKIKFKEGVVIKNVVANDINNDEKLDLVVTTVD